MLSNSTTDRPLSPAPVGRRAVAFLNDMAGMILMLLPVWALMLAHWTPTHPADEYAPLQFIPVAVAIIYGTMAGRSFGKRTMRLIILTKAGEHPSSARLLLRALAKLPIVVVAVLMCTSQALIRHGTMTSSVSDTVVAFLAVLVVWFWYPVSVLMLFSRYRAPLHDLIAGTIVCQAPDPRGFEPIITPPQTTASDRAPQ